MSSTITASHDGKLSVIKPDGVAALLPQHLADLARSGLTADDAHAAGLYSGNLTRPPSARLLGWKSPAAWPMFVFPYLGTDGRPTGYVRLKPSNPRPPHGAR